MKSWQMISITRCTSSCLQQTERGATSKQLFIPHYLSEGTPDEDDWGKLVKVLKNINEIRYVKPILSSNKMNFTIHWYMDGSHQIHEDCRGDV